MRGRGEERRGEEYLWKSFVLFMNDRLKDVFYTG